MHIAVPCACVILLQNEHVLDAAAIFRDRCDRRPFNGRQSDRSERTGRLHAIIREPIICALPTVSAA